MDDFILPPLREDLSLHEGPTAPDGSPTWSLLDPIRNQYFRIGWQEFEFLSRWQSGSAQALVNRVNSDTTLTVSLEQLFALVNFLTTGGLVQVSHARAADALHDHYQVSKKGRLLTFLKSYLFFKIRLVRPDAFLQRTLPWVTPLISKTFVVIVFLLALIGLYLIGRQWQAFTSTFAYFFNWEGMAYFIAAMFGVKILHELGHAYVATYYGCRVPSMGVVFLVFWPVFYTDTTDAWRLTSRTKRLHITAAGVVVEMILAVIATFLWSFLPDGPFKSVAFFVATVSWSFSLLLNMNPLLRFDGYYFLADYLDVSNLQGTAFALGKWQLRKWLFEWDDPKPYVFPVNTEKKLLLYAYCTWVYRFFLMIGIALLVYHLFFKVLAIVAMSAAIVLFLVAPIAKELHYYWQRTDDMSWTQHSKRIVGVGLVLLMVLILPWKGSISAPALLEYQEHSRYYLPESAKLVESHIMNHQQVQANQVLMRFESPELENKIHQLQYDVKIIRYRLRTELGKTENYGIRQADEEELAEKLSELRGLEEQRDQLTIKAKFAGKIVDLLPTAKVGTWLTKDARLFELVRANDEVITAYVPEQTVKRIKPKQFARFYPENYGQVPEMRARITMIDPVSTEVLEKAYLASVHGGDVAVLPDKKEGLVVKESLYRVQLVPEKTRHQRHSVVRGTVQLAGERKSLLLQALRSVSSVLIRESGF